MGRDPGLVYESTKRAVDVVGALVGVIVGLPVLLVIALVVRIALGSPILFTQIRPGLRGRPFVMLKFRTMADVRDAQGHLLSDEARLGRLGRFLRRTSLDELPELLNVIKGEMSLVGPRPLLMDYLPLYSPRQMRRHEVRPGLTGWAQVNGRNAISWEQKFDHDVWYVDHRGLLLDLKILFMTVSSVLLMRGINEPGQTTASPFRGTKEEARG